MKRNPPSPATVLVVDDHPGIADAVSSLIEGLGFQVHAVHDGPTALDFIQSNPVDLVLLDVTMPGMSGIDVLRALADDGTLPGLPVVMFSALDSASVEARRLGAVDFVLKGDVEALSNALARHATCQRL